MSRRAVARIWWVRIATGAAIAIILGYFWLPAIEGLPKAAAKEAIAGFAVALIMDSWWSVAVTPLGFVGGSLLWQATDCRACGGLRSPDSQATALIWGAGLLAIAVGTLIVKWVSGVLSRNR